MVISSRLIPLEHANNVLSGGKARNLTKLIDLAVPVPPGVVVVIKKGDANQKGVASLVRNIFESLNPPFIVRSSATAEDSVTASFAGVFTSVSPIHTIEELTSAILETYASVRSPKVVAYLKHYNILPSKVSIAVLIQEYKEPKLSGVVFTTDPKDSTRMVIEMTDKPSGVMSGNVTPYTVYVDKISGRVLKKISKETPAPSKLVAELFKLSSAIEKGFNRAQDVEWVSNEQGVWIVQSRPITGDMLSTEEVIQSEFKRLRNMFKGRVPHFAASEFGDAVEFVTPCTVSLLQKVFSSEGAWGKLVRRYYLSSEGLIKSRYYIVDIFGRLFVNKDEEKLWHPKPWRYRGLMNFLYSFPVLTVSALGRVKLQIEAFWQFKRLKLQIVELEAEIIRLEKIIPNIQAVEQTAGHLIHKTSYLLLQTGIFQQVALDYLMKKIRPHVTDKEWQEVLGSIIGNTLLQSLHVAGYNANVLLQKVGHRGFQELELSQPRWKEDPRAFKRLISKLDKHSPPQLQNISEVREKILQRFLSVWDQQYIATFFHLYDRFSQYREQLHDLWIREISLLRDILLVIDRETQCLNSIWFLSVDEIISHFPQYDVEAALQRRRTQMLLRRVPLPSDIKVNSWDTLLTLPILHVGSAYKGDSLTFGYAEGVVGSIETLQQGTSVDILVVKNLDPAIVIFFEQIKGIVTEVGGQLSHAAIVAREYSIPIIVLENAMQILPQGASATMNCQTGEVALDS